MSQSRETEKGRKESAQPRRRGAVDADLGRACSRSGRWDLDQSSFRGAVGLLWARRR